MWESQEISFTIWASGDIDLCAGVLSSTRLFGNYIWPTGLIALAFPSSRSSIFLHACFNSAAASFSSLGSLCARSPPRLISDTSMQQHVGQPVRYAHRHQHCLCLDCIDEPTFKCGLFTAWIICVMHPSKPKSQPANKSFALTKGPIWYSLFLNVIEASDIISVSPG